MKLGQTISIQDFVKYAPLGLQAKSVINPRVLLYYNLKQYNELRDPSTTCIDATETYVGTFIPGFIVSMPDYSIVQHLGVAWCRFETNDYVISKLPTKLLKRTPL
jgi:hypothetical protein